MTVEEHLRAVGARADFLADELDSLAYADQHPIKIAAAALADAVAAAGAALGVPGREDHSARWGVTP